MAGRIRSHRDLIVWQRAVELAVESYRISRALPPEERDALADQIRRAAVSVAANIAEGHGRAYRREYMQRLSVAHGELAELLTHLEIVACVEYATPEQLEVALRLGKEVERMLNVLIRRLIDTDR